MPATHDNKNTPNTHHSLRALRRMRNRTSISNLDGASLPGAVNNVATPSPKPGAPKLKHNRLGRKKTKSSFFPILAPIPEDRRLAPLRIEEPFDPDGTGAFFAPQALSLSYRATSSPAQDEKFHLDIIDSHTYSSSSSLSISSSSSGMGIDSIEKIYLSAIVACEFLRKHDSVHYSKYRNIIEPCLVTQTKFFLDSSFLFTRLADEQPSCCSCFLSLFKRTPPQKTLTDKMMLAFSKIEYLLSEDAEKFGAAITKVIKTIDPSFNLDKALLTKKQSINNREQEEVELPTYRRRGWE